jgi:hypothetical protein
MHREAISRHGFKLDLKMMYPAYTEARLKMIQTIM